MFDREIHIEHNKIPKKNILIDVTNYHRTQHINLFWYLAVLVSNS